MGVLLLLLLLLLEKEMVALFKMRRGFWLSFGVTGLLVLGLRQFEWGGVMP